MFVNKHSGIMAYRKLSRSTNRYVYVQTLQIGGDPYPNDIVKKRCPVYLPKDVADQRCDIFTNQHPTGVCKASKFAHVPYPDTIGDMQYVIGRDLLIKASGLTALADTCRNIRVFVLPWFDGTDPNGRRFWTPRLNNMFIKCAAKRGAKSPSLLYTIRMVLSVEDMNHLLTEQEYPSHVDLDGTTYPTTSVSIFARGPSKTIIELCQLCFNYSSSKDPLCLMAEVKPSHKAMYTCFWLPLSRSKALAATTKFVDITDDFVKCLLRRLDADEYKIADIAGRYYPDVADEGF